MHPPLPKCNRRGTGSYFQVGVRYFVPPQILLLLSLEDFAKYVNYLLKFLPYSLKLIRKLEVLKDLGELPITNAHRESKTLKTMGTTPHFLSPKAKSTIKCLLKNSP